MIWRCLIAAILALYAADIAVSGRGDKEAARMELVSRAALARGDLLDRRSLSEVISNLREQGEDAWPTVGPTALLDYGAPVPLTGIANALSVYCNESGRWLVYKSDRYGFRNDDAKWDLPVENIIVGDSFAQGACVGRGPADLIPNSLSLGVAGVGPLIELAILEEYEGGDKLLAKVLAEYQAGVREFVKQETRENGHVPA